MLLLGSLRAEYEMQKDGVKNKLGYLSFWRRKEILSGNVPRFPTRRWWATEGLSEIENIYFDAIRKSESLLDFGAGNFRMFYKLKKAGYAGVYHTLDIGKEHEYDYTELSEVRRPYGAVLCLDVIEHLPLEEGLNLMTRLRDILLPGGILVIQTPNARCVRNPLSWDMTHVHCYNISDLWAYLTTLNMKVEGYRVVFGDSPRNPISLFGYIFRAFFITRVLGCDFADNIALIARKE